MNEITRRHPLVPKAFAWRTRLAIWYVAYQLFSKQPFAWPNLPLRKALLCWRLGFRELSYNLYGFDKGTNPKDFVSDMDLARMISVNAYHKNLLDSKLEFAMCMKVVGIPGPETYGMIDHGQFHSLSPGFADSISELFDRIVDDDLQLVTKPYKGNHGRGVNFVSREGDKIKIDRSLYSKTEFEDRFQNVSNIIATEKINQGEFSDRLYSDTVNTIRLVTLIDPDTNEAFIAAAVYRVGTSRSYPVDNFKLGRGGLSCAIDLETGELSEGMYVDDNGDVASCTHHPETNLALKGSTVPDWQNLKMDFLQYARSLSFLPLIAWDIVVTDNGHSVLEANANTGVHVIQVHGPLLTNPRIRRFFEYYRVIK